MSMFNAVLKEGFLLKLWEARMATIVSLEYVDYGHGWFGSSLVHTVIGVP